MLVAFSVSPSGGPAGDSVAEAVAAAVRIVRESGLPHRTDPMFTTIEGEWDACFDVIRRATEAVAEFGPRVSLVVNPVATAGAITDIRPGHTEEMQGKLERLERHL